MQRITTASDLKSGLEALLKDHPDLKGIVSKTRTLPPRFQEPGFRGLAKIIIAQQVSQASADAVHGRFLQMLEEPEPQAFLDAGEEVWIAIGLTRAKQASLSALANAILDGTLPINHLGDLPPQEAADHLTTLKGIGPWTAEVYLLLNIGHPDIFPAGDIALQEAVKLALNLETRPTEKQTRDIAERWAPLRGIAAHLLWDYYLRCKQGNKGSISD